MLEGGDSGSPNKTQRMTVGFLQGRFFRLPFKESMRVLLGAAYYMRYNN